MIVCFLRCCATFGAEAVFCCPLWIISESDSDRLPALRKTGGGAGSKTISFLEDRTILMVLPVTQPSVSNTLTPDFGFPVSDVAINAQLGIYPELEIVIAKP
jgi:hypothetical protein